MRKAKDSLGGDMSKIKGISFKLSYDGSDASGAADRIGRPAANLCGSGGGGGRDSF